MFRAVVFYGRWVGVCFFERVGGSVRARYTGGVFSEVDGVSGVRDSNDCEDEFFFLKCIFV